MRTAKRCQAYVAGKHGSDFVPPAPAGGMSRGGENFFLTSGARYGKIEPQSNTVKTMTERTAGKALREVAVGASHRDGTDGL